jgi:NAD(P)-dependent dehydrogenase (short-subunit alcohol dehydrogenase family)/acyl dehydratase
VTRTLRVTREQLRRFADASGDRNPLHVDEAYARATPYGRCIAQGALVTVAALGVADGGTLAHARGLHIQFKQPVFPDEEYTVSLVESDREKAQVEVAGGGRVAATIAIAADPGDAPLPDVAERAHAHTLPSPRRYTVEELAAADPSLEEPYGCDLAALRALAAEFGAEHVPPSVLLWLAAASYTIGMLVPGEDAVFVGVRIARSTATRTGVLSGSITAVDDRTGLVNVGVTVEEEGASAAMTLHAFLRSRVPSPDRASIERYLSPSDELAGQNILVVGGSRGLGAALSGALATQGATVWVGFSRSRGQAESLRSEFGAERIRLLPFDAEDADQAREAFATLRADAGVVDGVVFCAAPPLHDAALHPAASSSTLRFVHASLALTLVPLAETLGALSPDGWLVFLSSSAVEDPPEGWPHYVISKAALEGAAAYCARHTSARVLVARAPKMWTDSTNTPLARLAAAPKEQVAAAIVGWAISGEDARPTLLTGDELLNAALERPSAG